MAPQCSHKTWFHVSEDWFKKIQRVVYQYTIQVIAILEVHTKKETSISNHFSLICFNQSFDQKRKKEEE
jgi:hypothetical protein